MWRKMEGNCISFLLPAVVISSTGPAAAGYSDSGGCLGEFLVMEGEESGEEAAEGCILGALPLACVPGGVVAGPAVSPAKREKHYVVQGDIQGGGDDGGARRVHMEVPAVLIVKGRVGGPVLELVQATISRTEDSSGMGMGSFRRKISDLLLKKSDDIVVRVREYREGEI